MKIPGLFFLTALAFLTACQIPANYGGNGSVRISLPASASARGAPPNVTAVPSARIQLVHNGVIVPLSGQNYLEQTLAGQTVTLDSLPTGKGFQVFVSIGTYPNGSGFFLVGLYRASDPFEISAGNSTAVTVTLLTSRVTAVETQPNSFHATALSGGTLYMIAGTAVILVSGGGDPATTVSRAAFSAYQTPFPSARVFGMEWAGPGYTDLWVNTDQGIFSGSSTSLAALSADKASWMSGSTFVATAVQNSGSAALIGLTSSTVPELSYYAGPGLSAGVQLNTQGWAVYNVGIGGFAAAPDYAYLSTGLGAVSLPGDVLNSAGTNAVLESDISSGADTATGVSIQLQTEDSALIGPVSTYSNGATTAYGFAGTTKGLYAAAVNPQTGLPSTGDGKLPLVAGTQGLNITTLSTATVPNTDSTINTAAYSATTNEILILKNTGVVDRIEAFEGLPSGNPQLTWYPYTDANGAHQDLLIAGSDATVEVLY